MIIMLPIFTGIGFMIAVLYMDLFFDSMALPYRKAKTDLPAEVIDTITAYYGRITQNPWLLIFIMTTTTVCVIWEIVYDLVPAKISYPSLGIMVAAMLLGMTRVIPAATRLAQGQESLSSRTRVAHSLFPSHILLLLLVLTLSLLQFSGVAR
jgi:hypothetical protein